MAEHEHLSPNAEGWKQRYEAEKRVIVEAWHDCFDGGIIFFIDHVGSTNVPGLPARDCIDIMVQVYPYPLEDEHIFKLADVGYVRSNTDELEHRLEFYKARTSRLLVVSHEQPHWMNHLVFRNYLTGNSKARAAYSDLKQRHQHHAKQYRGAKSLFIDQALPKAHAWHVQTTGFQPVEQLANALETLACPWMIASGWALDLFLDQPRRFHEDIDVLVFREDQGELQRFLIAEGWAFRKVQQGDYAVWDRGSELEPQVHQVHACKDGIFLDCLISPCEADDWLYRRQAEIRMPLKQARVMSQRGIPILAPEAILLFKSRNTASEAKGNAQLRGKDEEDFKRLVAALPNARKAWLQQALHKTNPEHPWLDVLG